MAPVKRKTRSPKTAPTAPPAGAQPNSPAAASVPPTRAKSAVPPNTVSPTPPNAASPATELADQLHSAAVHLLRRLRTRDRESGVGPAQLSALSVLVFGGPRSLGELADAEQVRPPTMSRIVASLQRTGLVRRHGTDDGRRIRLEATPRGVALLWEGRKRRVESLAVGIASLPEGERERLREAVAFLQTVIRNI